MKRGNIGLALGFFLISLTSLAQTDWNFVRSASDHFISYSRVVESNSTYEFTTNFDFNAVTVLIPGNSDAQNIHLIINGSDHELREDEHGDGILRFTNLVNLNEPSNSFQLHTGSLSGEVEVHLINSKMSIGSIPNSQRNEEIDCELPENIPQSVWRQGLSLPNTSRSFSEVSHMVVHHSAGSNDATNYTEVVRSIFIFHTESRGWSDIGYNYLIAPDGSLFFGRDPAGQGSQDEVIGAHFCGKNTGTMGICLLGTFIDVSPSQEAITTLQQLLSWKSRFSYLNPLGTSQHSGSPLAVIAGHRDGCATECPGQITYNTLPTIRTNVKQQVDECNGVGGAVEYSLYPNPVTGNSLFLSLPFIFKSVDILDSRGALAQIHKITTEDDLLEIPVSELPSGVYILRLRSSFQTRNMKFIVKR